MRVPVVRWQRSAHEATQPDERNILTPCPTPLITAINDLENLGGIFRLEQFGEYPGSRGKKFDKKLQKKWRRQEAGLREIRFEEKAMKP